MRRLMICAAALVAAGFTAMACAEDSVLELIGQPCRAKNILGACCVKDRETGKDLLVMCSSSEEANLELFFIEPESNTGRVFRAPAGQGSWCVMEVPGDRLVVTTYYDGKFLVFDLKTMQFTQTVQFPGEQYIWNAALGGDGRLYGGTYPGGKLGALDLNTYTVEDCGAAAPPNMYLRNVYADEAGRLVCSYIQEKPCSLVYDPATKKYTPAPEALKGILGIPWHGYLLAGMAAYKGPDLAPVTPFPFPAPPAEKGAWFLLAAASTPDQLVYAQGNAYYTYRHGDKDVNLVAEADLRGGRVLTVSSKGHLFGVRGQDYFVLKPGDKDVQLRAMPVESSARPILFLKADDKGTLWGGPPFGQTLFSLNPTTKETVNTGTVCDGGGEVYDVTFLNGKVYAASYSGGVITEYDPAQPWDQWGNKNPRLVAQVGDRGYIRPIAGIMPGPGGKLYSGWMAKYGVYGGAIAITDPASGQTDLIENPLCEQGITGLVVDDARAYIGTSLQANGLPDKKDEHPKFGVIDLKTRERVFEETLNGAKSVRLFGQHAKQHIAPVCVDTKLRLFDCARNQWLDLPANLPTMTGNGVLHKGAFYFTSNKDIVKLNLKKRTFKVAATAAAPVQNVAFTPDGAMYASCGSSVYRVKER